MYKIPTLEELINDLEKAYKAKIDTKLMPLSVQKANARIFGYALNALYGYAAYIAKQAIPITSEGEYLRRHCATIGLYEKPKSKAYGTILISGNVPAAVAVGEVLNREDGWQYQVVESVILNASTQSIKVEAVTAGAGGNTGAGTVLTFARALEGINPTAVVEVIGAGADAETDEELLRRYLSYMRNLYYGGADSDYEKWALSVPGVSNAWAEGCKMGAGTVTVRIMSPSGVPDEVLCQKVRDYIRSVCPVTVKRIFVVAPLAKVIDIEIANLQPDNAEMKAAVEASVRQYFETEVKPGGEIIISKINFAILGTTNLTDYKLVAPTDNVQCGVGEIAVLGEIKWY